MKIIKIITFTSLLYLECLLNYITIGTAMPTYTALLFSLGVNQQEKTEEVNDTRSNN